MFLLVSHSKTGEAPMALGVISALLKKQGFETKLVHNTFNKPLVVQDFVDASKGCEYVYISTMTMNQLFLRDIVKALKKEGLTIIMAGPHPTPNPEGCIEMGADIVIRNEVEGTLVELCDYFKGEKNLLYILGITTKEFSTERRDRIELDTLPLPDLDLYNLDLYRGDDGMIKGMHRIFTSRGCPGRCTFCSHKMFEQQMKYHPIDKIMEDIQRRVDKYGMNSFSIGDDCFTMNHEYVYEFCEKIQKIKPRVTFRVNSRANLVTPKLLKTLKEAGCHSIAFGIESGDPDTLVRVKKGVLLAQNISAPKMAAEAGLEVYCCMMTGFPWEKPENVYNNIKYLKEVWDATSLFQVSGSVTPFPGTEIYEEFNEEYGFTKYWLKPGYQKCGIQIYQNADNPYAVSTLYQRIFFDNTYIEQEKFFTYTKEYKKAVRKMVKEIGKHNLIFMFKDHPFKRRLYYILGRLSMMLYRISPTIEMKLGKHLYKQGQRSYIERLRDKRRGFVKQK